MDRQTDRQNLTTLVILTHIFLNAVSCQPLNLEHGYVSYTRLPLPNGDYPVGTVASFSCDHQHILSGDTTKSTCENTWNWTEIPKCIR